MQRLFQLPPADRVQLYEQAQQRTGLSPRSLEKDLWVCWTLQQLFSLPGMGEHLFFKGGTSLSKAWSLIDRFSEDIDVVIERGYLGFGGEAGPEHAASRKQQRLRLDALRLACQKCIAEKLQPALAVRLRETLSAGESWKLEADQADPDSQTLLLQFPSVFPLDDYLRPSIKIELGARSDTEPHETPVIRPYVSEAFPQLDPSAPFAVRTVAARRTFWEKAMLLHEESFRPPDKPRKSRLARHYYDLWCLITKGVAQQAVDDAGLFSRVARHREIFFRWSWVDYATLRPGALRILPDEAQRAAWASDYRAMRQDMFFTEPPAFDEVLRVVGQFEREFNITA